MTALDPPTVVGLDLSLTCTGVATPGGHTQRLVPPKGKRGLDRIEYIVGELFEDFADWDDCLDLVVIEGYAYGRPQQAAHLGELGGIVRWELRQHGHPVLDVAPGTLKRYATGNGQAAKAEVVANARERLGYQGFDEDEADAWVLRAIGLHLLGAPLTGLPKTHLKALDALALPDTIDPGWRPVVDVATGGRL